MMVGSRFLVWITALFAVVALPSGARAEVRALIVGTSYEAAENEALRLANPLADIRLIRSALRKTSVRDFTVLEDPTAEQWRSELDAWLDTLSGDDIGLFYFAGHGFQIEGLNFLMSGDGKSLIPLDAVITQITQRAKGAVIIIDACRNNPYFEAEPDTQVEIVEIDRATRSIGYASMDDLTSSTGGLAQLANLRGLSAVAFFSTEPGNVAEDGDNPGKGSPFAIEFAKQISRRQSLDEVFRKTAIAVTDRTEQRQSPWRQGDLAFNVFVSGMRALSIP